MPVRRLSVQQRVEIARDRAKGSTASELAARHGVTRQTINAVVRTLRDAPTVQIADTHTVTVRVPRRALDGFDAAAARHGLTRAEALRRLIDLAGPALAPDEAVAGALSQLAAQLNRVGLNLNQVAKALNEAQLKGQPVSYGEPSREVVRSVVRLTFEIMAQVQQMARGQRAQLDVTVAAILEREAPNASA